MIAAAIILPYLYHRINEEIRLQAEARFAEHYPNLKVSVRSAALVEGVGIEIRGMSFSERDVTADGGDDDGALVYLEHVILDCPTDLSKLLCPDVPISKITIRRPTFRIARRPDGSWNVADFMPLPNFGDSHPEVVVEGGAIEIVDERKSPPSSFPLRDVNLRIGSLDQSADVQSVANCSRIRTVSGSLTGDHLRRIEFTGTFDPGNVVPGDGDSNTNDSETNDSTRPSWDIGGVIEGLELSPELCGSIPSLGAERLRALGTFRGRGNFGFRLRSGDSAQHPLVFQLSGDVEEGRMDDPRLPYPLTNMRATICCNNEGFSVKDLFAQSGQTTLHLSGKMAGFGKNAPWELEAQIDKLKLEQSLTASLSPKLRETWDKYSPSGQLQQVNLKLISDVTGFRKDLVEISAICGDVDFTYKKFPYRLEHAHGEIDLKQGLLKAHLTTYSGNQPIDVQAEVNDPFDTAGLALPAKGWVELRGAQIPLDSKLFAAIGQFDTRSHTTLGMLDPHGSIGFYSRIWRDAPGAVPQKHFIIGLNRCSIKFKNFPYPIRDIVGNIERFADGSWSFRDLEGYNDTGRITCQGSLTDSSRGKLLSLTMTGTDIPLEEELRNALRPNLQRFWDDTKPRGIVNLEEIQIDWFADEKKLNLTVVAQPCGDTVSVEPKAFPYRMEKIQGRMIYRDGHVKLERFTARHGPTEMSATGYCDFPGGGAWHFHLDGVTVDRLRMDRELVQALPSRLRKGLVELNPSGPMYLNRSSLDLASSGLPGEAVRAGWNMAVGFHQGSIECGLKLHNIHGSMTMEGQFDGEHFFSQGELAVDSLMYNDIQFTDVRGPLWINDDMAWLGYAKRKGDRVAGDQIAGSQGADDRPRRLTGKVFGGRIEGDCRIQLDGGPHYTIFATLAGADLSKCAKETMAGRHSLQGKVFANVSLRGAGKSLNSLEGRGEYHLREANVYELPIMISLLKILGGREPDTNAFSESDVRFRIGGNHIYFDKINFTGDAISLLGSGDMDFQSKLNLRFTTVVGRDKWHVPILSPVLGGASEQAMAIRVTGPIQNPTTTREFLPLAQEALQQLQDDLRGTNRRGTPIHGNPTPAIFPGARPWSTPSGETIQRRQSIQPRPTRR